jgi:hypothetical protein
MVKFTKIVIKFSLKMFYRIGCVLKGNFRRRVCYKKIYGMSTFNESKAKIKSVCRQKYFYDVTTKVRE